MIERARANFGAPSGLSWMVRGFDEPIVPEGAYDLAICVGNSLALAEDDSVVGATLRQMLRAVGAGGSQIRFHSLAANESHRLVHLLEEAARELGAGEGGATDPEAEVLSEAH